MNADDGSRAPAVHPQPDLEDLARRQSPEEDRLLMVLRSCPVALSVYRGSDHTFVDVNPAFVRLFGWTKEELLGRTTIDLRMVDKDAAAHVRQLLESGAVHEAEVVMRTRDGEPRHVLVGVAAVELRGEPHAITTFTDVTARKIAEERTRASEERYRSLFDYAPDGILVADDNGIYLDANASLCRMLGYAREEMIGMSGKDIVVPVEHVFIDSALIEIKSSPDYKHDWTFRRKDGSTVRAEVIASQMPDGNLLALVRDVTERSRADARFRRLVESNAQGVMFWNASGAITGANDALLRTLGFSREDLAAGRIDLRRISPPEYRHLDRRAREELVMRGVCTPLEKEYIRKDGSRVPVLVGAAAFEDNAKEGICFVLDLTDRKRLEQQLLRTQRLESIGTLAGGIAHDLNNVLAPILLSVELLMDMTDDADARSILQTLDNSARHGASLVQQVLTFARGVQGRRIVMNPLAPLRDLFKVLRDTFPKNIDLQFAPDPNLWSVTGDPTQIHQVFLNLCVNARDAMPAGGTLSVKMASIMLDDTFASTFLEARAGAYVVVTVSDTGVGMSKDVQDRIFEPFYTTKATGSGTGLGLSTSLAIVRSHGGFMHVSSEPERGTTFTVYLPANPKDKPDDEMHRERTRLPRGNGEMILVVDDEEALRVVVKGTLERFGYHVLLASNGVEAVALYAAHRSGIAVVLTDMAMPIMGGVATIAALSAIDPTVKIIGSSGLADGDGIRRAMSAGALQFVQKPYTAEALLEAIRLALETERPPRVGA